MADYRKHAFVIIIFLIVVSCIAFGRVAGNDFTYFDDKEYITENNHIKNGISPQTIKWVFTAVISANWHPLTLLSHTLDWSLFGAKATGHHVVSLLLHIGAVLFLFLFLNKTTNNLWPSAFAAAFFALHPLRVESVAWAAERKDVLSMFFGLASIYAYAFYAENSKPSRYLLSLILFALSLMSKPMLVTLPFVLMLLDYWPLKRWQKAMDKQSKKFISVIRLVREKIPFLCLTIAVSIIALWSQNKFGAMAKMENIAFTEKFSNAIISYIVYLEKTFWPFNLAVFYPYEFSLPLWKVLISGSIIIVITVVVLYYISKLPFLFVGWFWYLGTLIPVIGLVQVGTQSMADRYTYLPSIGIAIILAWSILSLIKSEKIRKKIIFPSGITFLIIMSTLTWHQCGYWKNNIELWNHALQVTKDNYLAYYNRGIVYAKLGQYQHAIADYNEGIRLKPDSEAYNLRGTFYGELGQYQQAIDDFNKAIAIRPIYAEAYNNRGFTYANLGQHQRAIEDYSEAIRFKPDYAEAYMNRGVIYLKQGNNTLGCQDAQKACALGNCKTLISAKGMGFCR
ncbi:MAG: tetratricopeptide repeat protein [Deltaproteobacteria bacterium]|nr:tetratricopeptide repeat protein [Deltaproteobacteria bacterium]